jgi:hypothetical protein
MYNIQDLVISPSEMNSLHVVFLSVKLSESFYVSFYYDQSVVKDSVLIFTTGVYDFRVPYFINTKRTQKLFISRTREKRETDVKTIRRSNKQVKGGENFS